MKAIHPIAENILYSLRHPLARAGMAASGCTITLAVIIFFGYWMPVNEDIDSLSESVNLERKRIIDDTRDVQIYSAYLSAIKQLSSIDKKINSPAGHSDLVNSIDSIALHRKVAIISESYDEGKERNGYTPLYMELALQGDYQGLSEFLVDIRSLPTWTVVGDGSISRLAGQQDLVKAQLRLVTYHKTVK